MIDYFSYLLMEQRSFKKNIYNNLVGRPAPNVIRCFSLQRETTDVTFSVACGLSHPMGKTEFSSTAKNRTNSVS